MWRQIGSLGLILVLAGASARAATIDLFVNGFPTAYTPGGTITFQVELSGATDLNAYDVGMELNSSKGTAGMDFYFEGSPETFRPPDGSNSYVFDSDLGVSAPFGFVAAPDTIAGTNTALLSLSDFLASGQSVPDASPETMLATVAVKTTPAAGNLTLSFDPSVLELLNPAYQTVPGTVISPTYTATVPEPSSFALLGAALAGALAARRLACRRSSKREGSTLAP
jgi:hypothetical protein